MMVDLPISEVCRYTQRESERERETGRDREKKKKKKKKIKKKKKKEKEKGGRPPRKFFSPEAVATTPPP